MQISYLFEFLGYSMIMMAEIDEMSYTHALSNITCNNLTSRISIVKISAEDKLFKPLFENKNVRYECTPRI